MLKNKMLKTTIELVNDLKANKSSFAKMNSCLKCILKSGNKKDSDALLDYYLSDPFSFESSYLLPIFRKYGDTIYAEKLFQIYHENSKMIEESQTELLELLGYFKHDSMKNILVQYAFAEKVDYYLCRSAVLGLLNFNCKEYEELIENKIVSCYKKSFFPEYVPALVCKIEKKQEILENLFVLGDQYASSDCNAGIVLGFSLCGEIGRRYFIKAMNNPYWEVDSSGTGTIWATYEGIKNLNISFEKLYFTIREESNNSQLENLITVLFSLLERRIEDYNDEGLESFTKLHETLFEWQNKNESNNLIDLARKVSKEEEAYHLRSKIEIKITEELI